ncbi:hypothetical protein DEU56DRAFT_917668 [Suillus clintonianus]|uniref:uncharacterized protein n=1 Tax=Suillus clintonianus TaxID=1904413 RepID=UPI001B85C1CE|nr:uncharacterized protein DEU56DRAFT_917668 [Suillus clintonianus]KAG2122773.1 hypothetical protein DEU56DRAFT_917668 [Suillus clintonianus]
MASPKKSKGKRKVQDLDNGPPAGRVKKTRTPKSHPAPLTDNHPAPSTDNHPAPSGELSGPRRSGRSNAGTGGRNVQLEKLDSVFDASARKRLLKGSTSLGADIPRNPQAPDARKSRKPRKATAPPPYAPADANSMDVSEASDSQRGHDTSQPPQAQRPTVPPDTQPNLFALNNPYAAARSEQVPYGSKAIPATYNPYVATLPSAPSLVASAHLEPRFLNATVNQPAGPAIIPEHLIDPALRTRASPLDANTCSVPTFSNTTQYVNPPFIQSAALPRLPQSVALSDTSDVEDGSDESSAEEDTGAEDEDADGDADIGNWGAVRGRHTIHPGFSEERPPQPPPNPRALTPEFDFQYSRDEDEGHAAASLASAQPRNNVQYSRNEVNTAGFSEERPPQPPPNPCALTPEFDFQYSRDEDEGHAAASLASAQPRNNVRYSRNEVNIAANLTSAQQKPRPKPKRTRSDVLEQPQKQNDVLEQHQKKNGLRRLPDPEYLETLRQQSEINVQRENQHEVPQSRSEARPTQLGWYSTGWKVFLEEAKGECRTVHTLTNPFPTLAGDLPKSITGVLSALKIEWEKNGKQVESGVWPAQQSNMARLLYDDLATWRSELKKVVISLTPIMLDLIPPIEIPAQERPAWVAIRAKTLRRDSLFLRNGFDINGKTNNFANPALREAVVIFYYTGSYRLARRRPDLFRKRLPITCLALVSAAFDCVLLGFSTNGTGKTFPKFTVKEYGQIYKEMMTMIESILLDPYHGPKLIEQLEDWAAYGWSEGLKVDGGYGLETKHEHLKVVLD